MTSPHEHQPPVLTLTVNASADAALEKWAKGFLEKRGYAVATAHQQWETPAQFCKRLGIHYMTFDRTLDEKGHPNVVLRRGPAGRLIELLSNQEFDAFCRRNKPANL